MMPTADMPDILAQVLGMVGQMHPRFQPPQGGDQPVPEDAEVNFVGCFAESQLEKVDLKYYADANAASFNAMYWHARSDHVPYFAMSRHDMPLGHAFTAHGFIHEDEKPKWGVYDGCGTRCEDDDARWCGCSNEEHRRLPNHDCGEDGEKRFAVYKMRLQDAAQADSNNTEVPPTPLVQGAPGPKWHLTNSEPNSDPSIEITVPKGTIARANGREVLLYNASDATASEAAAAASETAGAHLTVVNGTAALGSSVSEGSTTAAESATRVLAAALEASKLAAAELSAAPSAAPVGKIKLPVGVSQDACTLEGRVSDDGSQVLKCRLAQGTVKQIPIRVIDEL